MNLPNYEPSSDDFLENHQDSYNHYDKEIQSSETKRKIRELIDQQIERKRLKKELADDFDEMTEL